MLVLTVDAVKLCSLTTVSSKFVQYLFTSKKQEKYQILIPWAG